MELTDTSLVVLLALLAVAAFGLIVAGSPRRGGPVVRGVVRALQVVALNVFVLALAGAALNDQYLFYSSWSDLFGARADTVRVHQGGKPPGGAAAHVQGPGLPVVGSPLVLPPLPHPGTRLQVFTVSDSRSRTRSEVYVQLPVGYNPRSGRLYPVIVGLPALPSGPQGFLRLGVLSTVDRLTAQHRLSPSIVVVPTIDTATAPDTECVDGAPTEPQTDSWLARGLPAWTAQHFRVQRSRLGWTTLGYSSGGWCAASVAMRHPDVYGAAVVLAGYFRPDFSAAYDPRSSAAQRGYDLVALARTAPPPVSMWVLTSREDSLSYPTTSALLSAARPPLDVTGTVLARGGHHDALVTPYVPVALSWLAQTLPGFRG
ncbi:alpha/beta hydrolase-fold protein [Terrabacter sp. NPDC080008]|uniref:alpha/beta hydrolase n=1 Tax=Terrabacter sp. NPDC080008 TaxID=3155176 RepID=UPI00344E3DFF